jgi:hypothetical protein
VRLAYVWILRSFQWSNVECRTTNFGNMPPVDLLATSQQRWLKSHASYLRAKDHRH